MTNIVNPVLQLPFERPNALTAPPLYERLRREGPLVRVLTPAGDPAWLVTTFDAAREVFRDRRYGRSHPAPEQASRIANEAHVSLLAFYHLLPAPDGMLARRVFARGIDEVRTGDWTIADDGSLYTLPIGSKTVQVGRIDG